MAALDNLSTEKERTGFRAGLASRFCLSWQCELSCGPQPPRLQSGLAEERTFTSVESEGALPFPSAFNIFLNPFTTDAYYSTSLCSVSHCKQ